MAVVALNELAQHAVQVTPVGEREATPGGPTITASCVSAPPGARARVSLTLSAGALADLELRQHYCVRLELVLAAAQGLSSTVTTTYLLKSSLH
jgi:hypothetical protein